MTPSMSMFPKSITPIGDRSPETTSSCSSTDSDKTLPDGREVLLPPARGAFSRPLVVMSDDVVLWEAEPER
ncbi:hypothetical protein EYF80_060207 [Liparis tanakae]|uniref:Uncharacterized protein n=1 Tax=Liparis tanakae TaxID=230148 RepID=A0A4Z2ELK3_9TELE|nr:hypothetical protein EYF80_060207 [Liparis tanakae]